MTDTTGPRDPEGAPSLDDQPLHASSSSSHEPVLDQGPPLEVYTAGDEETGGRAPLIAGVVLVLILLAGALWWFFGRDTPPPPQVGAEAQAAPIAAEPDVSPEEGREMAFTDAPALDETDPWLRDAIALLSSHPVLMEWLLNEDLVRRGVKVVANVAFDEDPRVHVPFMRPSGDFAVTGQAALEIAPASYERYDRIVGALSSVDAEGAGELYRRAAPAAEEAFRELGYPGTFEDALRGALRKVASVPVLREPPALERKTLSYHFADPELEALAPAQKLLLRMGPTNVQLVQEQAAAIARTLDS